MSNDKKKSKPTPPEIAAKGGKARAKALSSERKKQIATAGAAARWRGKPIMALHAGVIRLGKSEIPCANLPDGRRVLSESAILAALGRGYSGYYSERDAAAGKLTIESMHRAVSPKVLGPYIPAALAKMLEEPIAYQVPGKKGSPAKGIPAEALRLICETWIKARDAHVLTERQVKVADAAEILRNGFIDVGIAALVDEATGAQYTRGRDALAKFLESFVTRELAAYEKTFEDDFYKEMFRLRGWPVSGFEKRPGVVGRWTTDIVYKRLAPGVLQRLQEIIPRDPKTGRLKTQWHRALTRDKGYIALKEHLSSVTTIMKLAKGPKAWEWFLDRLDELHPRHEPQLLLPFMAKQTGQKDDEDE